MSAISMLEARIDEASSLFDARQREAEKGDFVARLTARSIEAHLGDLRLQLRRLKNQRSVEIIQVRLIGEVAKAGSIPIYLLAKLGSQFADAVHAASQRLKSGSRVARISSAIIEQLDLRLADLAPGSTRLFITGNVQPDLFGYSLLETTLAETFRLFHAEEEDGLAESVGTVGIRSARGIREFLSTIKSAELEVEISWNTPQATLQQWTGDYQKISRLSRALGQFRTKEPQRITISGEVVTLSARGRFEVASGDRIYAGTFPADLLPQVAEVHIGESVVATLYRTVVINTVTNVEKADFTLVGIEPTGQRLLTGEAE